MACDECVGSDNHVHQYNPNPAIRDITVNTDGTVLFPRPLEPSQVCVHELRNVVTVLEDGYVQPDDLVPMVWNDETCRLEPGCWPGTLVIDWNSTDTLEPPDEDADGNTYCDMTCGSGVIIAFRDTAAEEEEDWCVTHLCMGGQRVCLAGSTETVEEGTPVDQVCYDVSSWTFPASYGGAQGDWFIFGDDYNNSVCSTGPAQFPFLTKEFACWDDFGGDDGPEAGWNTLAWTSPDPVNTDPMVAVAEASDAHNCFRPAFRMDPQFPVGTAGPITWSFFFAQTSGATRFAAYDTISGAQLPVTILSQPTQPPGSSATVENGPNGQQVYTFAAGVGNYVLEFNPPPGVMLENVEFLIWNLAGVGAPERVNTNSITAVPNASDCCFSWSSINQLVNWMNSVDPIQQLWQVNGDTICQTVASGIGSNYGAMSSCDDSSTPVVTPTTATGGTVGGGGCPVCVSVSENSVTGEITINQTPGPTIQFTPGTGGNSSELCCASYVSCSPSTGLRYLVMVDVDASGPVVGSETYFNIPALTQVAGGSVPGDLEECEGSGGTTGGTVNGLNFLDCNGDARPDGDNIRIVDIDEELASGYARMYVWANSGDGCTPADRTGCLEFPAWTLGPDGKWWRSFRNTPGWVPAKSQEQIIQANAQQFHSAAIGGQVDALVGQQLINVSTSLANPFCSEMLVLAMFRPGTWRMAINGDVSNEWNIDVTTNGLNPSFAFNLSGSASPSPNARFEVGFPASNEFDVEIVPVGGTYSANMTATFNPDIYVAHSQNLLVGSQHEIQLIGWPRGD